MLFLLLIPLSILAFWFINYLWYNRYIKKFLGPVPLPIVGSALDFINTEKTVSQLLKYREKYNGDFKLFLGFQPIVFLAELKSIEALLNSTTNLKKSKHYRFARNWLGNGLIHSDGDHWRKHRKIITPAFHFQILEKYVRVFDKISDVLVDCLEDKVEKDAFDIYPYVALYALDIVCEATMGTSVNALKSSESKYVNSVKAMGAIIMDRIFSIFHQYDAIYRFSKNYQIEKEALKVIHNYSYSVIDQRKQAIKDIKSEDELQSRKKLAFLDLLLYHNSKTNSLSDDEIREEVDTLLFAGHDTAASAISFTLYNLANNTNIQEKVYQEIMTISGNNSAGELTYQDLNQMKYLELVIKESLRLYPPVPVIFRELTSDIAYCDKIVPEGMIAAVHIMGIQHDKTIYPNPKKFEPERFSTGNSKDRNPYAFIPFSGGSRNCIGQKFAMLEMKCVICKLIRNYQLLPTIPAQKLKLVVELIMRSSNGVLIRLKKR